MPRRILEGNVVSDKNDKTITVQVERRFMHPIYKKYIKKSVKFTAHDEQNKFKIGDRVQIIETRPISKTKRWAVIDGDAPQGATPKKEKAPAAKAAPKKEEAKKPAAKKEDNKKSAAKKPAAKKETKKD